MNDTIAAIATAPGKAGIAVVRVSGPEAFDIARAITGRLPQAGRFFYHDHQLVLGFKAPHSYTGEDVVEFQCYGGAIEPRRMLEACFKNGARLARRGEFTERAFLNGKLGLDQAESVLNLIEAKTEIAATEARRVLSGDDRDRALYREALDLSAELEHSLDISEDELPDGFLERIQVRVNELRSKVADEIAQAKRGALMHEGALVVLAGPPNAGKSSLMNALLGEHRAIVSEVPGTTRDSIEAWTDIGGFPVRLVDTAGIRETDNEIEAEGVKRANALVETADVVVEFGESRGAEDVAPYHRPSVGADVLGRPSHRHSITSAIVISAKCDLRRGPHLNVSAKTGEGIDELKRELARRIDALEPKTPSRKIDLLYAAQSALPSDLSEIVLAANAVRAATMKLGELTGATYTSDLLDNIFSRFCVGK